MFNILFQSFENVHIFIMFLHRSVSGY